MRIKKKKMIVGLKDLVHYRGIQTTNNINWGEDKADREEGNIFFFGFNKTQCNEAKRKFSGFCMSVP